MSRLVFDVCADFVALQDPSVLVATFAMIVPCDVSGPAEVEEPEFPPLSTDDNLLFDIEKPMHHAIESSMADKCMLYKNLIVKHILKAFVAAYARGPRIT